MPKHEPEPTDPMSLDALVFDDPDGASLREMTDCLAEEFLGLGYDAEEVLAIFGSGEHRLTQLAWRQLGRSEVEARVRAIAEERERFRVALRRARGGRDA